MNEFRLRVGNAVLALAFEEETDSIATARYFRRRSVSDSADVTIAVRFKNDMRGRSRVPSSLFLTKHGDGNGFSMADGLIEGRFSSASGEGELTVQRLITRGGYSRIYEQVFYQAYRSAICRKGADSFLLHSSGIIRAGRGYAFTGPSGAGKSTVTKLTTGARILNDEITVIDLSGVEPIIMDTPFNGYYREKTEGSATLSGIMLLEQAPIHRISRTTSLERIKSLAREIIPLIGLETPFSPSIYIAMLNKACEACARIPLYYMEFRRDSGFWEKIDEL